MKDYELRTKNAWNNYFREITHQEKHTENCLTCVCVGNLLSKVLSVRSMKFVSSASKLYSRKVPLNKPGSIKNEPLPPISFRSRAYTVNHDGLQIKAYNCCSSRLKIAIKCAG